MLRSTVYFPGDAKERNTFSEPTSRLSSLFYMGELTIVGAKGDFPGNNSRNNKTTFSATYPASSPSRLSCRGSYFTQCHLEPAYCTARPLVVRTLVPYIIIIFTDQQMWIHDGC